MNFLVPLCPHGDLGDLSVLARIFDPLVELCSLVEIHTLCGLWSLGRPPLGFECLWVETKVS